MFFLPGHGTTAAPAGELGVYGGERVFSSAAACGFKNYEEYDAYSELGGFGYYFPKADGLGEDATITSALDALADAMVLDISATDLNSKIEPVMTYLGQFIDHDITAGTDEEAGLSMIDVPQVDPLPRKKVTENLRNLRAGALNLDSVHGGGPLQGEFSVKLMRLMRYRKDQAKLWGGTVSNIDDKVSTPPQSGVRDLLRLGTLRKFGFVTKAELEALPKELRDLFINETTGEVIDQRAIVGDARNDENLAVAQLHMAILRLHNEIVQRTYTNPDEHPDAPAGDTKALFNWAQLRTSWIYQWLLVNAYLPSICDAETLKAVFDDGPVLYRDFFKANLPKRPDLMPLPLEFSVAAFRFGHTMVRDAYDWNEFFPDQEGTFPRLQTFTGGHPNAMRGLPRLPSNWPIDWERFAGPHDASKPDRATRLIDSRLALPLGNLPVSDGNHGVLCHLARRNLRRGHRLNVPHAQSIIDDLEKRHIKIRKLSADELKSGATGAAVEAGKFEERTPLWF